MKLKLAALAFAALTSATPLLAAEQTLTFSVPGMTCTSCPYFVEAAMGDVAGVISVTADSNSRAAIVVFDDEITTFEEIADASAFSGYEAFLLDAESIMNERKVVAKSWHCRHYYRCALLFHACSGCFGRRGRTFRDHRIFGLCAVSSAGYFYSYNALRAMAEKQLT